MPGALRVVISLCGLLLMTQVNAAGLPDLLDRVRGGIVAVGTWQATRRPPVKFRGTGFAVGNGRFVVTNAHVLPEKLDSAQRETLNVFSGRGRQAQQRAASVVKIDRQHDLALLRIAGPPLPAFDLARHDRVREGQNIVFTGFPIGTVLGLYPVTHRGIVSAISPLAIPQPSSRKLDTKMIRALRSSYDVLQLDATAYPGNSGSPVYDPGTGAVIGVLNSVLVKASKENLLQQPSGISYAIPVRHVRKLLADHPVE